MHSTNNACDLTGRLCEFAHALLSHGGTALGGVIEVSADLYFVCLHVDIDARVVRPLYKQELTHGGVVFLASSIREEELRAPAIRVKQRAMKALEHGIVGHDWVKNTVPVVSDNGVSLGIVGHAPVVEPQTWSRGAFVVERDDRVGEKLESDDARAQQLLKLDALSLLESDVNHVSIHAHGSGCEAHEGSNRFSGHRLGVQLRDLLICGIGLTTTGRAMATPQEGCWSGKHV